MRHLTDLNPGSHMHDEIEKGDLCRYLDPDHEEPCEEYTLRWLVLGATVEDVLTFLTQSV